MTEIKREFGVRPGAETPPTPICPYCEKEIEMKDFGSNYSMAQSEAIIVVWCPHCLKVLGFVYHDCSD